MVNSRSVPGKQCCWPVAYLQCPWDPRGHHGPPQATWGWARCAWKPCIRNLFIAKGLWACCRLGSLTGFLQLWVIRENVCRGGSLRRSLTPEGHHTQAPSSVGQRTPACLPVSGSPSLGQDPIARPPGVGILTSGVREGWLCAFVRLGCSLMVSLVWPVVGSSHDGYSGVDWRAVHMCVVASSSGRILLEQQLSDCGHGPCPASDPPCSHCLHKFGSALTST